MDNCISFSNLSCHSCKIVQCNSAGSATQICKWIPNVTFASMGVADAQAEGPPPVCLMEWLMSPSPRSQRHWFLLIHLIAVTFSLEGRKGSERVEQERGREKRGSYRVSSFSCPSSSRVLWPSSGSCSPGRSLKPHQTLYHSVTTLATGLPVSSSLITWLGFDVT